MELISEWLKVVGLKISARDQFTISDRFGDNQSSVLRHLLLGEVLFHSLPPEPFNRDSIFGYWLVPSCEGAHSLL